MRFNTIDPTKKGVVLESLFVKFLVIIKNGRSLPSACDQGRRGWYEQTDKIIQSLRKANVAVSASNLLCKSSSGGLTGNV